MCRLISILFILTLSVQLHACPLLNKISNKTKLNHRTLTLVIKKCTLTSDNLKAQKETLVKAYTSLETNTRDYCFNNIDQPYCMDDRAAALRTLNKLVLKAQQLHWKSLEEAKDTATKTTLDTDIDEADALIKEASALSKSIDAALEGAL